MALRLVQPVNTFARTGSWGGSHNSNEFYNFLVPPFMERVRIINLSTNMLAFRSHFDIIAVQIVYIVWMISITS